MLIDWALHVIIIVQTCYITWYDEEEDDDAASSEMIFFHSLAFTPRQTLQSADCQQIYYNDFWLYTHVYMYPCTPKNLVKYAQF